MTKNKRPGLERISTFKKGSALHCLMSRKIQAKNSFKKNGRFLSKREINSVFHKLSLDIKEPRIKPCQIIQVVEKGDRKNDIWIVSDSTSSFNNFNCEKNAKLERTIR